jgi:uncharacterized lipoprotein
MTNIRFMLAIAVASSLVLASGCKSLRTRSCNKSEPYAAAQDLQPLKIPPGLDSPDTRAALLIPELNEPEAPRAAEDPCLDEPPAFVTPQPAR